jgi:hypothetical protein
MVFFVRKIGSRSFLLLELIIALLLITLCVLPFVSIPSGVQREEMLFLQRLELQRLSDRTCASIKERIYTKEITWEQLSHPKGKRLLLIDDVVSLPLKELAKQRYSRKCYIYSDVKKGQDNLESRLVRLRVSFKRIPAKALFFSNKKNRKMIWYDYQFLVKQEKVKV